MCLLVSRAFPRGTIPSRYIKLVALTKTMNGDEQGQCLIDALFGERRIQDSLLMLRRQLVPFRAIFHRAIHT